MKNEEYPKLIAVGLRDDIGKVYCLEDERFFYGYAQNETDFCPRVKTGWKIGVALRWCPIVVPPKGDEDVHKLYNEAMELIKTDEKSKEFYEGEVRLVKLYNLTKEKEHDIQITPKEKILSYPDNKDRQMLLSHFR
jgi:hypothetical protein